MAASKDACFIKTFRAKIVPERLRSFVMPADGVVSNWIPADGRVQKDTIMATVNEDEIELERKELEVKSPCPISSTKFIKVNERNDGFSSNTFLYT